MNKLIFIGLGLYDGFDISYKGVDILKKVDKIYAEFYTAIMERNTLDQLQTLINKEIKVLNREQVEDAEFIVSEAKEHDIAFLCQGDPLTATTHVDLLLLAKQNNISIKIIHSSSVVTAVPGLLGLQFYKFGRTTTLAYPEGEYFPESPYDMLLENLKRGLHTLILLDIHAHEKRYMTANEGVGLLLKISEQRNDNQFNKKTLTCVVARAGSANPKVVADFAGSVVDMDFGEPLHSIVIPGKLHFREVEALKILANAPDITNNV